MSKLVRVYRHKEIIMLTPENTLKLCREHWALMAQRGDFTKTPALKLMGFNPDAFRFDCFCCKAAGFTGGTPDKCESCPLYHYWNYPNEISPKTKLPCEDSLHSPYRSWKKAGAHLPNTPSDKRKLIAAANRMVKLCDMALEDLKKTEAKG
jgi:hypothetical protein